MSFDKHTAHLTWTRVIDYRPLSPPDVGKVKFLSENILQEDGVLEGDDFTEIWEREPMTALEAELGSKSCTAAELLGRKRKGYFVQVGNWFALTVSRDIKESTEISEKDLADSFDKADASELSKAYMLMHVCVAGSSQDWSITHALDPEMIGKSILDATLSTLFRNFEWVMAEGSLPDLVHKHLIIGKVKENPSAS